MERLFLGIRAEAVDFAADVEDGFVEGVAEAGAGVAADDEAAGLGHEGGDVADGAADDDVAPFHGDAAAGGGVSFDDDETAVAGCPGTFRGVPFHADRARHDVLRHAPADAAVNGDAGLLVHAANEVPGVAADVDLHVGINADRQVVHAVGMENLDVLEAGFWQLVVEKLVQLANTDFGQVERSRRGDYTFHE